MALDRKLGDSHIREMLLTDLHAAHKATGTPYVIKEELSLNFDEARIDVAAINGLIEGFEIKSDLDSMKRFVRQMRVYSRCFEALWLVTTDRHLGLARRTLPRTWGIRLARFEGDGVVLETVRPAQHRMGLSKSYLLSLLRKDELLKLLPDSEFAYVATLPAHRLRQHCARSLRLARIREAVVSTLKSRPEWRVRG